MAINAWYFTCMAKYFLYFSAVGTSLAVFANVGRSPFLIEDVHPA